MGFKRGSLSDSRFVIYGVRESNVYDFPQAAGELIQNGLERQKHLPETQGFQFKGGSVVGWPVLAFSQRRCGNALRPGVSLRF
ncbi:hypothetical protein [Ralstonia pseudosolanacearum]|uniref:hypothetical protein n=1 Tax=Ralstonia pseudosolanacearum TaxID=1310165 RepID=UPI003CE9B470